MKLLVIGAAGFIGGHVMRSRDLRFKFAGANRADCDVTDRASVQRMFAQTRPEIVVLTAALADIDRCEKDPALARAINIAGAENVAAECARSGARLLFTSSGAVFGGEADAYDESDPPSPVGVYGKSKAEAEKVIREIVPNAAIVRLSLALGHSPQGGTNATLDKLEAAFRSGNTIYAPTHEYRNVIDVETLARWILDIAFAHQASGIFNLGASDAMSRYDIVSRLAETMGYSKDLVVAQNTSPPDRAPRGRRHMLTPARIREFSSVSVPTCMQAIERSLHVPA